MEVLLPCDDLYLRSTITQRPNYDCPRHAKLSPNVESELAQLLKKEIEYHQQVELLKSDLKRRFDWTNLAAFNTIDTSRYGSLAFNNITSFCRLNGYHASEGEIIAVIRRLDIDADQRINFEEFCQTMHGSDLLPEAGHDDPKRADREDAYFAHTSPPRSNRKRSPTRCDARDFEEIKTQSIPLHSHGSNASQASSTSFRASALKASSS